MQEIHLYCNIIPPRSRDKYFFTIELNRQGDGISFDNTLKGHRILKQVNEGKIDTADEAVKEEWDVFHFVDGKFKETIHEKWVDKGEDDVINGTIYRRVWEVRTPEDIDKRLLQLNDFLWKNRRHLNSKQVEDRVKDASKELCALSLRLDSGQKRAGP